jgi:hypothetical protein
VEKSLDRQGTLWLPLLGVSRIRSAQFQGDNLPRGEEES